MSCVSVPTATQFATLSSNSISTSFSSSVSTLSPTVTTIDSVSCVPTTSGNATTSLCSTAESVSTIAGGTTTVQVPVLVTIPIITGSPTATLFSTSCTDGDTTSVSPSAPSDTSSSIASTSTSTATEVITTSVPTTVTFQSSFTSDGTVIYTSGTSTTFAVIQTTETTLLPVSTGSPSSSGGSSDTSAIVGGAVGGVTGAIVLSLIAWFFLRKKRRYDFDDDFFIREAMHEDHPKNVLRKNGEKGAAVDSEPRPYTYGALNSAGPSSTAPTPSTEVAPALGYGRPGPPPRLPPLQTTLGKSLPATPRPMLLQPNPSQSNLSSSAYTGSYTSTHPLPPHHAVPSPTMVPASGSAPTSVPTLTGGGGYDQRRPLQVVNDYAPSPPHPFAAVGPIQPSEKTQIYLHPQTGLTVVRERPEASGSTTYVPRSAGSPEGSRSAPPTPVPAPVPGPVTPPDAPHMPIVHQDAGRAPGPVAGAGAQSDAPPAYSE
ncbi:hypothetical protein BD414DRAFT_491494 [Trametes punicea]|nr:hypothetical protein BD414DRAFT_491494 [Trametes punicea]